MRYRRISPYSLSETRFASKATPPDCSARTPMSLKDRRFVERFAFSTNSRRIPTSVFAMSRLATCTPVQFATMSSPTGTESTDSPLRLR